MLVENYSNSPGGQTYSAATRIFIGLRANVSSTFPVALRFRILRLIRSRVLMHARLRVGVFANGHTSSNTPDPIRTRKLSGERPGQYWGGGPPGKPLGCCWLFQFSILIFCSSRSHSKFRTPPKREVARTHHLIQTLSQNGYGDGSTAHPKNKPIRFREAISSCERLEKQRLRERIASLRP